MRLRWALIATSALAAALALAACGDDHSDSNAGNRQGFEINGSWRGELTQRGLKPFVVTARIGSLEDPAENIVHYTEIDCGGDWTYLGGDGQFRFREVINRGGGGDCKGVGIVTLRPRGDDELDYTFKGGGIESTGILHRLNP